MGYWINLINNLFTPDRMPKMDSQFDITGREIEKIFSKNIRQYIRKDVIVLTSKLRVYVVDDDYKLPSLEQIKAFLKHNKVNKNKFVKDKFDCDNFAVQLWGRFNEYAPGYAFGYAISSKHVFNIMIDANRDLYVIEPQSDKIIPMKEALKKSLYKKITLIIM